MLTIDFGKMLVNPKLDFGSGDGAFSLVLRPIKASDRMAMVDAALDGYEAVLRYIGRLVVGWDGIADINGNPIPFQKPDTESPDPHSSFDRVFGFAPMSLMAEIVVGVMTFAGLRQHAENIAKTLALASGGDGDTLRPTAPPSSGPATSGSSGPGQS